MTDYFSWSRLVSAFPKVLEYLPDTLMMVAYALAIGIVLGLLLAYVRMFRVPVLNQIAIVFISFIRGTPEIVQLFIVYYGTPILVAALTGVNLDDVPAFYFAVIGLGLNQAGFMAELFRGAFEAVPAGQFEAGYAAGLTWWQTFRRVVVPQAIRAVIPGLGIMTVGLFQTTVLASALGVMDVLGRAIAIGNATSHSLEPYAAAAIIFIVVSLALEWFFRFLDARFSFGRKVAA